ncbi:26S proteasome non-ATPase regulatory subunit 9 [Anopheles nili]|uniref:26S proteasome non-ATPase regulatory subunit 9 n=1 Tax=Anopheles nili TaxID=185578 RepID=UPI00237BF7DD|nr:26S proteasome non-ATPase regulatory subunit 9 [Anopheles nili]
MQPANSRFESARKKLFELSEEIKKIDAVIFEKGAILLENNTSIFDVLIDTEGYPRDDLDIPAVRKARHTIICLQNDRVVLMKEIQKEMNKLHENERQAVLSAPTFDPSQDISDGIQSMALNDECIFGPDATKGFAIVEKVQPGHLGHKIGLKPGDRIIQMGTICRRNFKSVKQINSLIKNSVGKIIPMVIRSPGNNNPRTIDLHVTNAHDRMGVLYLVV